MENEISKIQSYPTSISSYRNDKLLFLFIVVVFLIMPIVGIVSSTIIVFLDRSHNKKHLFFLFILLSLYMGGINATKTPSSDQIQYMNAYLQIPNQSFIESLTNIYGDKARSTYKEMGYGLLNFLGYYLSFGNYKLFIVEFSVLLYMLMMASIYKFFSILKIRPLTSYVISAAFILCFFSQYFNLTIHLQRQIIAVSVMLWAIVDVTIKQKVNWVIPLFAMTLHTSVALFLPFFILIYIRNRLKIWHIFALLAIFCFIMGVLSTIFSTFSTILGLSIYGIERLANVGTSPETRFDSKIVILFSLPLIYISIRELWIQRKEIRHRVNLLFIVYCFLMCFAYLNPDNTMQYRYFMMSYSFMPFILPLLFMRMRKFSQLYLFTIPTFLILRFYFTFKDIVWDYAPVYDILLQNYIGLLLYKTI